jgi:hypothetical protein
MQNSKTNTTKSATNRSERRIFKTHLFKLCGSEWSLVLSPVRDIDEEFLAVHLVNHSDSELFAAYKFTIKNQIADNEDLVWSDPEGVVRFSSVWEGDNEWGCDDLISMDELDSEHSEFVSDRHIHLEVELEVYRDERIHYESAADGAASDSEQDSEVAIEGEASQVATSLQTASLEQAELMALAKEDISSILKKLSKGRDSDEQKMQEDRIVRNRLLLQRK